CFFFFQAEDGIRDFHVTGVQTCALPICPSGTPGVHPPAYSLHWVPPAARCAVALRGARRPVTRASALPPIPVQPRCARAPSAAEIGRASCRERGQVPGAAGAFE